MEKKMEKLFEKLLNEEEFEIFKKIVESNGVFKEDL